MHQYRVPLTLTRTLVIPSVSYHNFQSVGNSKSVCVWLSLRFRLRYGLGYGLRYGLNFRVWVKDGLGYGLEYGLGYD